MRTNIPNEISDNFMDCRILKPLNRVKKNYKIGILDIETWGLSALPKDFAIGVCLYEDKGLKVCKFDNLEDMRSFVLDTNIHDGRIWYAHNGGNYDYLILFRNLFRFFKSENVLFNGSRFISARYEDNNKEILFWDSFNIFDLSIEDIGKVLGYKKLKTPEKFKNADYSEITEEDYKYCIRDCEILYYALQYMFQITKVQKPTIASIAMDYFRRQYLDKKIMISQEDVNLKNSYFGGRVEAYFLGRLKDCYVYDINSLYPYSMLNDFPNPENIVYIENPTLNEFMGKLNKYEGNAMVLVDHPEVFLGYLPKRTSSELIFPIGQFVTCVNFNELRYAISHGVKILNVYNCCYADKMKSPFVDYVYDVYEKKQNSEGGMKLIYKKLLNALYGKFGENHETYNYYTNKFTWKEFYELKSKYKNVDFKPFSESRQDGYYVIHNDNPLTSHSIFSFCSYITSYARIVNLKYQEEIRKNGIDIYYTDTDSFFVSDKLPDKFVGNELGKLKFEDYKVTEIRGNKDYEFVKNDKVYEKIKGVKKDYKELDKNVYEYYNILKLKSALRRGKRIGRKEIIKKVIKKRYDKYSKRIVLNNGITIPLFIYDKK